MKNTKELREELSECFAKCKSGEMSASQMNAFTSNARVMINSARTELDYNKYTDNNRKIDFLEV
jgi:hypothetical protein